jgi:hypothetical protein
MVSSEQVTRKTPMETQTIEIRPKSRTSAAEVVPVERALKSLVQLRAEERAWQLEKEKKDRELLEANRRELEKADEHDRLKKVVAVLLTDLATYEGQYKEHAERLPILDRELAHQCAANNRPHDHIFELNWRKILYERLPDWIKSSKAALAEAVANLQKFEALHLNLKK